MLTLAWPSISSTRLALLPLRASSLAPGPTMVTLRLTSNSLTVRVITCCVGPSKCASNWTGVHGAERLGGIDLARLGGAQAGSRGVGGGAAGVDQRDRLPQGQRRAVARNGSVGEAIDGKDGRCQPVLQHHDRQLGRTTPGIGLVSAFGRPHCGLLWRGTWAASGQETSEAPLMLLPNDSTRRPCRTEAGAGLLPVTVHGRRAGTQPARCCSERRNNARAKSSKLVRTVTMLWIYAGPVSSRRQQISCPTEDHGYTTGADSLSWNCRQHGQRGTL